MRGAFREVLDDATIGDDEAASVKRVVVASEPDDDSTEWVESVVVAPAERYLVDVRFADRGADLPALGPHGGQRRLPVESHQPGTGFAGHAQAVAMARAGVALLQFLRRRADGLAQQVHAVQQRSAELAPVTGYIAFRALAARAPREPARAGIGRGDELEARRVDDRPLAEHVRDDAVLECLAQRLQGGAAVLRQLVV